jgi:hypothetical protein
MGARSLDQAWPRLGLENWSLAAVRASRLAKCRLTSRIASHRVKSTPLPPDDATQLSPFREIITASGEARKLQWEEFHPAAAACCVPAIVIILVCGLSVGQPFAALVATAGAFSVGFGLFQRLSSFTAAPMLLALLGMTISATVGTLTSASPLSEGIAAAIWAFSLSAAVGLGTAVWWIVLQWSIALVIAAAFPAEPSFALLRGVLVALGRHASARHSTEPVGARLLAMRCSSSPERERPAALLWVGAVAHAPDAGTGHPAVSLCGGARAHGRSRRRSLSDCKFFERLLDRDDNPDRAACGIARKPSGSPLPASSALWSAPVLRPLSSPSCGRRQRSWWE